MLQRPSSSGTAPVCVAVVCAGLSVLSLRKCPLLLNRDPANTAGRAEGRGVSVEGGIVPFKISGEQRHGDFSSGGDKRTLVSEAHLNRVHFLVFNISQAGERKDRKTIKWPLFTSTEANLLRI